MTKKRSPFSGEGLGAESNKQNHISNNCPQAQRQRLLDYLRKEGSATTIKIRQGLNILCVAPRVFELRKAGYPIETHWLEDITPEGYKHRVANYILPGEVVTSGQG